MENRAFALITGVFVLGVVAAIIVWAQWLGGDTTARLPYRVVSAHPVSGLNEQGNVRYRGISVGKVTRIQLDPKDKRRILIRIEVDQAVPVTGSTYAQLGQEGITGIAYVHLLEDEKARGKIVTGPDNLIEIPLRPSFFDTIADHAEGTLRDARELIASLNAVLVPENRRRILQILASVEKASRNLDELSERLPGMVERTDRRLEAWLGEDNRRRASESLARLNDAAKELPALAAESRKLVEDARALVAQANKLAGEAGDATGAVQRDTLPRVHRLAETVEQGAQRIGRLAETLEREPSSVLFGRAPARPGPGEPGFQQ